MILLPEIDTSFLNKTSTSISALVPAAEAITFTVPSASGVNTPFAIVAISSSEVDHSIVYDSNVF
jgi:hypothetical protein